MPNLVPLPDGTTLILNGAFQGVAGFGLANDPNLNAVLYDPTQPIGSRFSILGSTIVARMYHSEAVLLPDGRVLVSGSDPQTANADGTPKYPEEFRIEVYPKFSHSFSFSINIFIRFMFLPTLPKGSHRQRLPSPITIGLIVKSSRSQMYTSPRERPQP